MSAEQRVELPIAYAVALRHGHQTPPLWLVEHRHGPVAGLSSCPSARLTVVVILQLGGPPVVVASVDDGALHGTIVGRYAPAMTMITNAVEAAIVAVHEHHLRAPNSEATPREHPCRLVFCARRTQRHLIGLTMRELHRDGLFHSTMTFAFELRGDCAHVAISQKSPRPPASPEIPTLIRQCRPQLPPNPRDPACAGRARRSCSRRQVIGSALIGSVPRRGRRRMAPTQYTYGMLEPSTRMSRKNFTIADLRTA